MQPTASSASLAPQRGIHLLSHDSGIETHTKEAVECIAFTVRVLDQAVIFYPADFNVGLCLQPGIHLFQVVFEGGIIAFGPSAAPVVARRWIMAA